VFRAFAQTVADGEDEFVVLDTAPTGHTLLLLDATEAYHREVAKKASDMPSEVTELLPRLRNSEFTRILIVTLPEATPVHEAMRLQEDLRRARIEPFAWVVNQSFALSKSNDPLLQQRAQNEIPFINEVKALSTKAALVAWTEQEPVGQMALMKLLSTSPEEAVCSPPS
jgi:arsenite-transporting ATPase